MKQSSIFAARKDHMQSDDGIFTALGDDIWLDNSATPGPNHVMRDGRRYTRFMDRIYIPGATSELNLNQVLILNRYRDSVLSSDPQFEHRARVRRLAIDFIGAVSNGSLFEIGCGLYPLVDELGPQTHYAALEIDTYACAQLRTRGLDCCSQPSDLRHRIQSIDLVVALFVMQFHVPDETLRLLTSSTGPNAVFLFNVATKDPAIRHVVSSKLLEQGIWMYAIQATALRNDTIFVGAKRAGIRRALRGTAAIQRRLKD